jgi:uncharacterized membrane protein YidH (DUF202 family)
MVYTFDNLLELFNELIMLSITLLLTCLTNYTYYEDQVRMKETREKIGWVMIGIISVYIAVNMLFICHGILKEIKSKLQ